MVSESQLRYRGLERGEEPAYLNFAQEAWGKDSPQSDPRTLDWLYANPNTAGMHHDLIVLTDKNRIVGAHHRMRIPWRFNGQKVLVPSLHDLYILPAYRKAAVADSLTPPGLQIMLAAFEREPHIALFGLSPDAERIYKGMRIPTLRVFWLEKIRSRIKAGAQIVASRLGRRRRSTPQSRATKNISGHELSVVPCPSIDDLLEALSIKPNAENYPDWDLESYTWRFFDARGPKNMLLLAHREHQVVGRLVVSLGLRHRCVVARIVELLFHDSAALGALLRGSEQVFSAASASVCLAVTSSEEAAQRLVASGWRFREQPPGARWFSRDRKQAPEDLWISGGAWDFGCDARIGD